MSHVHHAFSAPVAPAPPSRDLPSNGATPTSTKNQIDECLWALQHPELQKACYLARVCAIKPPKRCQYRDVVGMLQVGPTCGLTALSMLLGGTPPPEHLLATARELSYTNNGEIFSARNLFQLICDKLMARTETLGNTDEKVGGVRNALECVMHEGRLDCAKVRKCLLASDCLFVPHPFKKNRKFFNGIIKAYKNV